MPFGGATDGKDPHVASGGLLAGSCGAWGPSGNEWAGVPASASACIPLLLPNSSPQPISCPPAAGYGKMDLQAWPHWTTVAVSPGNALYANATRHPLLGCGACLELFCDPRPGFEVQGVAGQGRQVL